MIEMIAMLASSIKDLLHCDITAIDKTMYFISSDNETVSRRLHSTPSNNTPVTVGVIVGTCVALTVGVVIVFFISRCVQKTLFVTEMLNYLY